MMLRLLIISVVIFCGTTVSAQDINIQIKSPSQGAHVTGRPIVGGLVGDENVNVWVVVHPMETADYWIQPSVTIRKGGLWRVQVYIGRPGSIDIDKHFELRAVANPLQPLYEGKVLGTWPDAQARSDVIEVIRR